MTRKPSYLKSKRSASAFVLALITFWAPGTFSSTVTSNASPFCACCADPGAWDLATRTIEDYEMEELNRLKLDGVANFYSTDAWPYNVSGVNAPDGNKAGYFVISIVREQRDWKLFFRTLKGEKGALILTMPGKATFFDADITHGPRPERKSTTCLYKEVRLAGQVRGTGIFARGITPKTEYRLVLQGAGNQCLNARDLYRWNLRVSGPRAGYTIFGYFAKVPLFANDR